MARLVEDSEDEFPDLAVVIGTHGSAAASKSTRENPTTTPLIKAVQHQKAVTSSARLQIASFETPLKEPRSSMTDVEKPKSRRRVLKTICDNLLLRPYDHQTENTPSFSAYKKPKHKLQALLMTSKAHEECEASSRSCISSASEEEEISIEDSTGLSDFIVDDSSFLDEESTEDEMQPHPSRSRKRLVKGSRSPGGVSSDEGHSRPVNYDQLQRGFVVPQIISKLPRGSDDRKKAQEASKNSPTGTILKGTCILTPPSSPQKTQKRLLFPKKGLQIPLTPHRPSMDAFWDPDVINEWNEEYSPRKTPRARYPIGDDGLRVGPPTSPNKRNQSKQDPKRYETKKSFAQKKHDIAEAFLRELDESITDGKVFEMAALTDGIKIIWSKKLNTTAGRANWKRDTLRSTIRGTDGKLETKITYCHHASIELAEKVIDDEERLLNVIAHEFCHLANFMVSGIRNNPHGKEFKTWAAKCSRQFADRGIHVTTKHSYDIDYKYVWECTNCGTEFKRHSKSIDPIKHQCGSCKSKLIQTKPMPRANAMVNDYQLFVRENMKKVKEQNPGSPQKQVMTMLGKMYQEHKALKLRSTEEKLNGVGVDNEDFRLREESPSSARVDLVTRKLTFLDLTSP